MTSFLRRALEDQATQEKSVVITGPLSEAFTQALNASYAKTDDNSVGGVSLESQALDSSAMQQLAKALIPPSPEVTDAVQIYGVSENEINDQDIVEITNGLAASNADRRDDFVVVLDTTGSLNGERDVTDEKIVRLTTALECVMDAYGCRVYKSLEAFAKDRYY